MLKLYELAGADPACRFSPACWRTRMALAHKGVAVEAIPWRFTEKAAIAPSGGGTVPVLVVGERWIADSWAIARWLDEEYPNAPSLFGGGAGRAVARFHNHWADMVQIPGLFGLIVRDVFENLAAEDRDYFRTTREARIGMSLEAFVADRDDRLPAFRASLGPMRRTLAEYAWLGGDTPNYADYAIFGGFQWARCVSNYAVLAEDDPVRDWRERMLDLFDGLARHGSLNCDGQGSETGAPESTICRQEPA